MSADPDKNNAETNVAVRRIRNQVKRLLDQEVPAQEVSFALAYVATELGLMLGNEAARVFPVVLGGLCQATEDFTAAGKVDVGGDEQLRGAPAGASIH